MRYILILTFTLFGLTTFGQRLTWDDWEKEAKSNKRLQPKYGQQPKTVNEKESDEKFIKEIVGQEQFKGDKNNASNHLIELGFNYMYRGDLKTAMYRFNQAYLLDSTNTDIYWGYGAIYMTLGNFVLGKQQYKDGLSINPSNTHLLTDLSTYFMEQYFTFVMMPESEYVKNPKEDAKNNLDSAMIYLLNSYQIDPKDQNTTFKLSTVYYYADDCENAWRYHNECKALGGRPITESYTNDLKKKCKKKK